MLRRLHVSWWHGLITSHLALGMPASKGMLCLQGCAGAAVAVVGIIAIIALKRGGQAEALHATKEPVAEKPQKRKAAGKSTKDS